MTVGLNPYRGPVPAPRPGIPAPTGMPPSRFPWPPSPAVIGSLVACTAGPTVRVVVLPGTEAGTDRCPTWAPLPSPAATWPPAPPAPPPSDGIALGAAAGAAAPSQPAHLAIWGSEVALTN